MLLCSMLLGSQELLIETTPSQHLRMFCLIAFNYWIHQPGLDLELVNRNDA